MHGVLPESRGSLRNFHIPWVKDPKVRRAAIDTMASRAKSVTGTEEFYCLEMFAFGSFQVFQAAFSFVSKCLFPTVWAQSRFSFPRA